MGAQWMEGEMRERIEADFNDRLWSERTPTPMLTLWGEAAIVIGAEAAARLLIDHQRMDGGACRCGWAVWGASYGKHVADVLLAESAPPHEVYAGGLWPLEDDAALRATIAPPAYWAEPPPNPAPIRRRSLLARVIAPAGRHRHTGELVRCAGCAELLPHHHRTCPIRKAG